MLVSGLLLGFIAGLLSGGDWRRIQTLRLSWWPALLVGAVARVAAPLMGNLALGVSVVGLALVSAVAIANRALPGAGLVALGSGLNLIVTLANGGMPVDSAALAAAGVSAPADGLHVPLNTETRLPFLADVLLLPVVNSAYSVGDVGVALGGFWMVFRVLRQR